MTIHVTANDLWDARRKLGISHEGDIRLDFRSKDYGAVILPGFRVYVPKNSCQNREFETLREALAYLRMLHQERLAAYKKARRKK